MKSTTTIFLLFCLACFANPVPLNAQEVAVIKNDGLQELLHNCSNQKIKVVNFWATWCRPCIEELPYLDALSEKYSEVDVHLVSLDPLETLDTRVAKFAMEQNLAANVVLLDETDFDPIINAVDQRWSGAIPATVIVDCQNGKRLFFERKFESGELEEIVDNLIRIRNKPTTK